MDNQWSPVSQEPVRKQEKAPAFNMTMTLPPDVLGLPDMVNANTALAQQIEALTAQIGELKEELGRSDDRMATLMDKMERVMLAPRKVTLRRDDKGFAKDAITEVLGVK